MIFHDRHDAGRQLLPLLESYRSENNLIILGLARGGVVVASEVAKGLNAPLNVVIPRKIGSPDNPELAIGAIMEDGEAVFHDKTIRLLHVSQAYISAEIEKEREKARQRLALFRKNAPLPNLTNSTVILVDDGIATGATMLAAIKSVRKSGAHKIIVAIPVAAPESLSSIEKEVDKVICLYAPDDLGAIGYYYENFDQTDDSEVLKLIEAAKTSPIEQQIKIQIPEVVLDGNLVIPHQARGLVLFAHGSGSSRFSPRNRYVAQYLMDKQLATLLIDLLSREEEIIDEVSREFRFDINLLANRLIGVIDWIKNSKKTSKFNIGLFGSSTGAAAALVAAAQRRDDVKCVVSRGGRPDLAASSLKQVNAPTLLIVGGWDTQTIELNREALALLSGEKLLEIVPGATHLFEEPGTLEFVAHLAGQWFFNHLS